MQTKLSIKEIAGKLANVHDNRDPFFIECLQDDRKGVQQLLHKWQNEQNSLQAEKERLLKMCMYEKQAYMEGYEIIAGIDEVGRGPLAGPVVASAVVLPRDVYLPGVNDSKKLTAKKRNELYELILKEAIAVGIGVVDASDIDKINIYEATKKAMSHAINQLSVFPDYLLLDAMKLDIPVMQKSLIKGDALSISIASASIVAKVYRDRLMEQYSKQYPEYHFHSNSGYGTKEHLIAIEQFGPCPIHRMSFAPLKALNQLTLKI